MSNFPHDIDLDAFWDHDSSRKINQPPASAALIAELQAQLGYRLPPSYVAFMQRYNGGYPHLCCCPTEQGTSWAEDHCAIDSFLSIGRDSRYSLGGDLGSRFMIEEWGYPDLGVYICNCPSAGHDMIALDYRECGPEGEPRVVHVDQEGDYEVTVLAPNFEAFVRSLVSWEVYDTSEQDYLDDLDTVASAPFSPLLQELLEHCPHVPDLGPLIRQIALRIVQDKRYFALHADPLSYLLYDLQFWLYQNRYPVPSQEAYLEVYQDMIAFAKGFSTGGYAPDFIRDWFRARLADGHLHQVAGGFALTPAYRVQLLEQLSGFRPAGPHTQEQP
ncbi:SMI1/KNR4 family protein [Pseudomonas protegens]|uniref:SMI1/KNR4 family protein n=1 Tax=Pseudomonas protegens TaxID=380021 RepID=A0A2T6GS76_9PSED|nr:MULTISPECIES: SMI1/KNR4 family protein [Pseudomonas]PUA47019.1 SMI1/KNR4 family protein [Pseudomonas protegens]ULT68149.1 SMI1/KNR4 family protein [Pseudomonas sp. BC42]